MRTTKQNIIELDHGDDVTIRYRGAEINLTTSALDPESNMLEVAIPLGKVMSGLSYTRFGGKMYGNLAFAEENHDIREELHGPLRFITFANNADFIAEGYTEEQVEYLRSRGMNPIDAS